MQTRLQDSRRAMETALHGAFANLERRRGLDDRPAQEMAAHDDGAMIDVERGDAGMHRGVGDHGCLDGHRNVEALMIPPPAQQMMAKRAGATVVEVPGSHAIYVSKPEAVAKLIAQAASGIH